MSHAPTQGPKLDSLTMEKVLAHIFERNEVLSDSGGGRGTPVCIWGTHGLGKTQMVKDYATSRGWHLAYCAPAQFEEMGDLHGLPTVHDPTPDKPFSGDEYTIFAPPEWVPKETGPGILLLDDINRADDRILRGLMQLLQNFEMFSWQLPPKWQIVATANPEGADYSVTPMSTSCSTTPRPSRASGRPRERSPTSSSRSPTSRISGRRSRWWRFWPQAASTRRRWPPSLASSTTI
jgi:hypothetical protein